MKSWPTDPQILRVGRFSPRCTLLGPGTRAVVWVQGCPLNCGECVAPEMIPFRGGDRVRVETLAARIDALGDIDGLTLSGGEPMSQAGALVRLVDDVRRRRDLTVMSYTGSTIERLRRRGSNDQRALLDRLDILVDGPYIAEQHVDRLWRGSANQRVHLLTERVTYLRPYLDGPGVGVDVEISRNGVTMTGVPPVRTMRGQLCQHQADRGVYLANGGSS